MKQNIGNAARKANIVLHSADGDYVAGVEHIAAAEKANAPIGQVAL